MKSILGKSKISSEQNTKLLQSPNLGKQFAWISFGRIVAAIIQAVLFILLARQSGPNLFGLFSAVYGFVIVVQAIFDLGITTLVIRERARDRRSKTVSRALFFVDKTSIILLVIVGGFLFILGTLVDSTFYSLLPLALWMSAERHAETWLGVRLADGDAHINSIALIFRRLGSLILYLGSIRLGVEPLLAFSISTSVTSLAAAIWIRSSSMHLLPVIDEKQSVVPIIRESLPFWINSLGTQFRNLDTLVVSVFAGQIAAGFYGAASRITGPLRILSTSLATVLLPAASSNNGANLRRLVKPILLLVSTIIALYLTVGILVPYIVPLALGTPFTGAIVPIQIVVAGLVFASIASLLNSLLQGVGRQRSVAAVSSVSSLTCLVLIAILSSYYQAIGAASALAFSFLIQMIILLCVLFHEVRLKKLSFSE